MTTWWVEYDVAGFGSQKAGPYSNPLAAEFHLRDIARYEGVSNARVSTVTTPDQGKREGQE